ncbi:MAG TPA: hypothetical protein VE619_02235 [Nitrososphaeraceae archaeon]|nr:hypothetical protein [Nitrososphaeraceae archaeon]
MSVVINNENKIKKLCTGPELNVLGTINFQLARFNPATKKTSSCDLLANDQ